MTRGCCWGCGTTCARRWIRESPWGAEPCLEAGVKRGRVLDATEQQARDQALVRRLQAGDGEAFSELVRAHQGTVYRLLLRMLGNPAEAEDVAQDVFVAVFKAVSRFRGDSRVSTWIFRIATNHARNRIKYLARRQRHAQQPYDESQGPQIGSDPAGQTATPEQMAHARQMEGLLQRALQGLEEAQRELIILRDLEHVSYEEIQAITGLPAGTVKSRLHRARAALHRNYQALQETPT